MSPRTGRPKSENPMNDRIYVRVTKQEKKEIMDFSSESGYSILELIRIGIEKIRSQKNKVLHRYQRTQHFKSTNPKEIDKSILSVSFGNIKNFWRKTI